MNGWSVLSAACCVVAFGCLPPAEDDSEPPVEAPADLQCGGEQRLVSADGFELFGPVDVTSARLTGGQAVIEVQGAPGNIATVSFTFVAGVPPLLPPLGPAQFFSHQESCFGEGCDPSYWILRDLDDVAFFEVGRLTGVDGTLARPLVDHLSLRAANDDDAQCEDRPPCVAVVRSDEGEQELLPNTAAAITIAGQRWQALAGPVSRTSFIQDDEPCADCAAPGLHTFLRGEAVLYRVE